MWFSCAELAVDEKQGVSDECVEEHIDPESSPGVVGEESIDGDYTVENCIGELSREVVGRMRPESAHGLELRL